MLYISRCLWINIVNLDNLYSMRNSHLKLFSLVCGFLFCSQVAFAQQKDVKGIVKDVNGEPLIGVSVVAKGHTGGTTIGTVTDFDGNYVLSVPESAKTLEVSYIGMITQNLPLNKSVIDVVLREDIAQLDEIVVIGYGTVKKNDLTGSVGTVNAERIGSVGTSSVMSALQGSTPGVDISTTSTRPGAGFKIQIRGQNSIEEVSPLYVVDGIIVGDIDYLNPSDIERIDVLKDASSTAIYGSRGSSGVVIVKTKGANIGGSRLNVSYDGFYGVRKIARVPDFMDGREWTDYRTSKYYETDMNTGLYSLGEGNKRNITQNSTLVHNSLRNQDYEDWLGLATQDGSQQNHYININGSGDDIAYSMSAGYQTEKGNFMLEGLERYVLKLSVDHKANKFFSAGASFSLSHQTIEGGSQNGYRDLFRIPVVLKAYDENGDLVPQPGIATAINGSGNFTSSTNPIIEVQSGSSENRRFDILGSVYAQLTPIENLTIKTTLSPRFMRRRSGYYYERTPDRSLNEANNDNREVFEWTWDNVANYSKTFNGDHNLNVTLINSMYKTQTEDLIIRSNDLPYNSGWYNVTSGNYIPLDSRSGYSQTTLLSYAGRANYDYKGKYLVTGTVRYDGSSKLADKWDVFPSAALAWRLSEEDFFDAKFVSNLKLRASLGYSGNNNISAYATLARPNINTQVYYDYDGNVVSGFGVGSPVNTALTWEKTREWNFGLDFGFFDGRISGSVDVYDKLSDHILMARKLAMESGVVEMTDNIGSVNNRGIELFLKTLNVNTKDWTWETTFTFAHNKNAIRSLYGRKEDVIGEKRFIGKPIVAIYDYKVNGVYSQAEWNAMTAEQRSKMGAGMPGYAKALDMTGDGEMSEADKVVLGSPDPDYTFGVTSNLRYKNFDLVINLYGRQGVYLEDRFLEEFGVGHNSQRGRPKVVQDYYVPANAPRYDWTADFTTDANGTWATWGTSTENPNAKYPVQAYTGNFYGGNGRYQDASFVKIRNITLGYTVPKEVAKKAFLNSARVYFNVLNPFTFTNYVGWDPEYATSSLTSGNGPSSVTYQLGVNLKF